MCRRLFWHHPGSSGRLGVRGRRAPGKPASARFDPRSFITIVAIDERTIAELGAYNGGYPRRYQAQLVEQLLAGQPRVVAFDIGFFEPTVDDADFAAALEHALEPLAAFSKGEDIAVTNVMPDAQGTIRSMPLLVRLGDPNEWRNGLVFVGVLGATGLADDYWTPMSQQGHKMAGVEIHANVAATLSRPSSCASHLS